MKRNCKGERDRSIDGVPKNRKIEREIVRKNLCDRFAVSQHERKIE